MKYLTHIIIILLFYYNQVQCADDEKDLLACGDLKAYNFTTGLKDILTRTTYYTKAVFTSPSVNITPPLGYVCQDQLVETYTMFSDSVTMRITSLVSTVLDNYVAVYETIYDVHPKYSIFQSRKKYRMMYIYANEEKYMYEHISILKARENVRFALVYDGINHDILIFQTCDRKFAWIQIKADKLQHFIEKGIDPLNAYHDQLSKVILDLKIEGEETFIVKNKFPFDFKHSRVLIYMLSN